MYYLKLLNWLLCFVFLLAGCSPKKKKEVSADVEPNLVTSDNLTSVPDSAEESISKEDVINNAITSYNISLSADEKKTILKPIRESLNEQIDNKHLKALRVKIESMLNLREAQLRGDANFDLLLNRQIENTFSQADWENTTRSTPDMDALLDAREKLSEQFPDSSEEAIFQAQDALFKQALTQKLRIEVTKEIVISMSEIDEFLSQYKANSDIHLYYMNKHLNLEAAALELKKDQHWNKWLSSQKSNLNQR